MKIEVTIILGIIWGDLAKFRNNLIIKDLNIVQQTVVR